MQMSIFDGSRKFKITKPIRLIECFAGYGSQALALKYLGVKFEHYKIAEWAVKSIQAYKDMHFSNDNTNYSNNLSFEEIIEYLYKKGISSNYNEPMTKEQIKRMGEDKARTVYNNIQATHNLVSVCNVKGADLDIVDTDKFNYILTYSFPCFTADSLVLTDKGYKNIIDIKCGDMVLTHDNTYAKVVNTFDNGVKPLVKINAMAVDEIKCTPNHKFLVRSMYRIGHFRKRTFSEPKWKPAQELTKSDYLGVAINQKSTIPTWNGINYEWTDGRKTRHKNTISALLGYYDFWWIIGRYMGDGWQAKNGVYICCPKNKTDEMDRKLNGLVHYTKIEDRTTYKYIIPSKEWVKFVSQFGKLALNKHLTNTIIDLPIELLKGFLNGYMSADGCLTKGLYKATTISRELAYGIAQCVAKVYRTPYRIYHTARQKKYVIENRIVNQHDTYQVVWKIERCKQDKAFYDNGFIWFPIKQITEIEPQNVYDIEVENNHSFTVQNTIVHNCQDLSNAGKRLGMGKDSGTRSGLLWEIERILSECKELPQVLLMENVPEVIGAKNIKHFAQWIARLDELGYHSKFKILNGTDFEIPQNRKRCFMVSVLGDYFYNFPSLIGCELKLKDVVTYNYEYKLKLDKLNNIEKNAIRRIASSTTAKTVRASGRGSLDRHSWDIYGTNFGDSEVFSRDPLKETSRAIRASQAKGGYTDFEEYFYYSPLECFRLMGVKDEDFERIAKNQSKSSLYHLAGDSIIVNCLMAIFNEML